MTIVRGHITGAHRDTTPEGKLEHKLLVRLATEDGASGDVTFPVSPLEYETFAKNFPHVVEVEVKLRFDKPAPT